MSPVLASVILPLLAVVIAMGTARRTGGSPLSRRVAVVALGCFVVGGAAGFVLANR